MVRAGKNFEQFWPNVKDIIENIYELLDYYVQEVEDYNQLRD